MPLSASIPLTAPRPQRIFGALALSPAFRHEEEPEPEVSAVLFAAQPNPAKFVPAPAARLVLEPLDPSHRVPSRGLGNAPIPPRSLLTPSQRAQLRRPPPVPGSDGLRLRDLYRRGQAVSPLLYQCTSGQQTGVVVRPRSYSSHGLDARHPIRERGLLKERGIARDQHTRSP